MNHRATKNTSKRAQRVLSLPRREEPTVPGCLCSIIRCLVLGQSTEFKVTSFKFKRSDISAVAFDFGLWTSDIGLTKTIQLLNYLTISLCVSVAKK